MFNYNEKSIFVFALFLTGLFICGCSSGNKKPELEQSSLAEQLEADHDSMSLDTPEHILFEKGKKLYQAALYSKARETFELLRDGYPFGPYAEFAEIKIADSYFYLSDYTSAAPLYEEFLNQRPGSKARPYVMLKAARSYQLSNRGAGRDKAPLEKALELYQQLLRNHKDSVYADSASSMQAETEQIIIDHDLKVINFYKKRGKEKASRTRLAALQDKWGHSELVRLESVQLALSEISEIPPVHLVKATRQLNHPEQPVFLALSRNENKESTSATAGSVLARLKPDINEQMDSNSPSNRIVKIECEKSHRQISIFLGSPIEDPSFSEKYSRLIPKNEVLEFTLPNTGSQKAPVKEASLPCFPGQDLSISSNGIVKISSNQGGEMQGLNHPPRVVVKLLG